MPIRRNQKHRKKAPASKNHKNNHKKSTLKLVNILLLLVIVFLAFGAFLEYKYIEKTNVKIKILEKKQKINGDKVQLNSGIFDILDEEQNFKTKARVVEKKIKKVLKIKNSPKASKENIEKQTAKEAIKKKTDKKKARNSQTKSPSIFKYYDNKAKIEANTNLRIKPRVAIVIDDVTTQREINQIKALGLKVTVSIMPPTSGHQNSAKIARGLKFYMVHLPLQAMSYAHPEANTLHINDSYDKVLKRIKQVRAWYPKARYLNNHTGSKFTSNARAMDRLFRALIKYHFHFIDSKTIGGDVVKNIAKKYHQTYLKRNIFLDNRQNYSYVLTQIKKALDFARKNGYVIAIGHPHQITLKVLRQEKAIFKDFDLVYVSKIAEVEYPKRN